MCMCLLDSNEFTLLGLTRQRCFGFFDCSSCFGCFLASFTANCRVSAAAGGGIKLATLLPESALLKCDLCNNVALDRVILCALKWPLSEGEVKEQRRDRKDKCSDCL